MSGVSLETGGAAMRKQTVIWAVAALLVSYGVASAQKPPTLNQNLGAPTTQSTTPDTAPVVTLPEVKAPDATGAPIIETTGQAPNFEDRWSAQGGVPYLSPTATIPSATLPAPETTGQAPTVTKKMGAEMESAGDVRAAPDSE